MNAPAVRRDDQLILEGIVTTFDSAGSVNIAPMGPVVNRDMEEFRLRPFETSLTYQNLSRSRAGVFHVIDDCWLLAQAAIGTPDPLPPMRRLESFPGSVIEDACRWYAFEVTELDASEPRVEMTCRVVEHGEQRPFFGWNRAMHSVLEGAILATRVRFLPYDELETQLASLRVIVEKTASSRESKAFEYIERFIQAHGARGAQRHGS